MQKESFGRKLYRMFIKAEFQGKEPIAVSGPYSFTNPAEYRVEGKISRITDILLTIMFLGMILLLEFVGFIKLIPAARSHDALYGMQNAGSWVVPTIVAACALFLIAGAYLFASVRWMIRNFKTTNL